MAIFARVRTNIRYSSVGYSNFKITLYMACDVLLAVHKQEVKDVKEELRIVSTMSI